MHPYIDTLNSYLKENNAPEEKSILDILYYRFCIMDFIKTEEIHDLHRELGNSIQHLPLQENDRLSNIVCDLCEKYQHEAFRLGVLTGFRLFRELQ